MHGHKIPHYKGEEAQYQQLGQTQTDNSIFMGDPQFSADAVRIVNVHLNGTLMSHTMCTETSETIRGWQ